MLLICLQPLSEGAEPSMLMLVPDDAGVPGIMAKANTGALNLYIVGRLRVESSDEQFSNLQYVPFIRYEAPTISLSTNETLQSTGDGV